MDAQPEMGGADMSLTEEEAQLLISVRDSLHWARLKNRLMSPDEPEEGQNRTCSEGEEEEDDADKRDDRRSCK